jgi:hypothetical protein
MSGNSAKRPLSHASKGVDLLLGEAGQPKSASGHACIRLCGFVEQCSKAQAPQLREWAFSRAMTEKLFTFYVEWNETDQHRSMKLVLDLIVQLQRRNPDRETAAETEKDLLKTLVSIVIGTSTKPVAKSAIKTIDHLLSKGVFNLEDLRRTYVECRPQADSSDENEVWRSLFAEILQWMRVHFVCPTAGRFIVLLYRGLRARDEKLPIKVWHQWLLDYLADDPNHLEGIKNYIFVPLFRSNRPEALNFLREVANHDAILTTSQSLEMDISTLLQLAALETGKRVGLVEEPGKLVALLFLPRLTKDALADIFESSEHRNQGHRRIFSSHPTREDPDECLVASRPRGPLPCLFPPHHITINHQALFPNCIRLAAEASRRVLCRPRRQIPRRCHVKSTRHVQESQGLHLRPEAEYTQGESKGPETKRTI